MKLFSKKLRPCPFRRAAKKKPATGADAPARAIATGAAGEAGNLPSQSPNGASSPRGGAKYVRRQKLAQSQVSPPPLGGAGAQWAPFSADRAGRRECPPKEGGEGSVRPPSRCPTGRERRFAVSLAFSHALRAYKGKAVGLWSHLPVRSAQGVCHRQTAPYNPQLLKKLAKLLRSLRSASCAHVRYPLDEHERQRAAKGAN